MINIILSFYILSFLISKGYIGIPPPLKFLVVPDFTYSCYSSSYTFFLVFIHCLSEPFFYKEVIFYPLWQQAMDEKLSSLHMIDTWDLVTLPPGMSVVC